MGGCSVGYTPNAWLGVQYGALAGALFDTGSALVVHLWCTAGALFGTGTKSLVVEDLPGTKLGSGQSGKVSQIF